mmetsp:Transcript_18756/g.46700  ORF Transcript_18756/g.46700 Transcript_18756/m.46700 type:complete len:251 (-) Transcript_18756:1407-2159(-)
MARHVAVQAEGAHVRLGHDASEAGELEQHADALKQVGVLVQHGHVHQHPAGLPVHPRVLLQHLRLLIVDALGGAGGQAPLVHVALALALPALLGLGQLQQVVEAEVRKLALAHHVPHHAAAADVEPGGQVVEVDGAGGLRALLRRRLGRGGVKQALHRRRARRRRRRRRSRCSRLKQLTAGGGGVGGVGARAVGAGRRGGGGRHDGGQGSQLVLHEQRHGGDQRVVLSTPDEQSHVTRVADAVAGRGVGR